MLGVVIYEHYFTCRWCNRRDYEGCECENTRDGIYDPKPFHFMDLTTQQLPFEEKNGSSENHIGELKL